MDPSQEPLLTVNALFCKARPPQARQPATHHSHSSATASASSSASASASSSSQPPGRAHSQARVVTFVGQIVHVLTNTRSDQRTIAVPQDPLRYPLQRHALRLYQKKCPDLPLDLVIWLAPLGDQTHSTLKASRSSSVREANSATAEQRNRDLNTTDSLVKKEDDASTALSWSDSDRSQFSQTDSNSDDNDDDAALLQQPLPDTMVAVLLSRTFDQDKDKGKDNDDHWRSLQKRLKSGNIVTVRKAVMLFDETNGKKVVSCVGIPDRTTFKVSSRPRNSSKSKRSRTSTTSKSVSQMTSEAAQASGIGSKKRKPSVDSSSSGQQEGGGSLISAKRMRACTGNKDKDKVIASTRRVEDRNAVKQEPATLSEKEFSVREPLILASAPAPNSLQLLVQRAQEHTFGSRNHGGEKITYFSTLVSNMSYRSVSSERSHTTPDGNNRTSSSNNAEQIATTRHICWLRDVRYATLTAVCAECGNSYRNLSCVFGCRSRTWRLGIRVECIVRDGTGQACLMVTDDQEEIMWTLLGVNIKTGSISSDSTDYHANARNTVLAIVARRGELSYRTDSPDSPASSSLSLASSGGHVETINHDRSERAQFEERLWLDVCRRCPSVERTLLLDAVAKQGSCGTASPGISADRSGKLKTSLVRLGPETTILTLVPPPLVLCAVDIKRIQPKTEARMLLSQLRG